MSKALKALITLACAGGFTYYAVMIDGEASAKRDASGVLDGGSLLSRYGALCDGSSIHFDDAFSGKFRCHIEQEPVAEYLKALVYAVGGSLVCQPAHARLQRRSTRSQPRIHPRSC